MLVPPMPQPRHLMVLLHGYGSDGNDLIAIGRHWSTSLPDTLFVSPNAPDACDINPSGYQWFPIQTDRMISRIMTDFIFDCPNRPVHRAQAAQVRRVPIALVLLVYY